MKKPSIENPINRYSLGMFTEGVKSKADDSLDIYIQPGSPGKDKESNLLPAAAGGFYVILRCYAPQKPVIERIKRF